MGVQRAPVAAGKPQIERLPICAGLRLAPHRAHEKAMPAIPVLVGDKACKAPLDQRPPHLAEQRGTGKIDSGNKTVGVQGEIADRRKLVQIDIPIARNLERRLRPSQLLVLNLQLDLMHLQFVHKIGRRLLRHEISRRAPGQTLGSLGEERLRFAQALVGVFGAHGATCIDSNTHCGSPVLPMNRRAFSNVFLWPITGKSCSTG